MSLREFLVKDCQNNKQIASCSECRYEDECNQIHIDLIIKAICQWLENHNPKVTAYTLRNEALNNSKKKETP